MIDFKNASFLKLKPVDNSVFFGMIAPMLVDGESIIQSFQSIRDGVVFTNKRIFAINIQGLTGKKRISPLCHTAKFKHFQLRLRACLTLTANLKFGFRGLEKSSLSS